MKLNKSLKLNQDLRSKVNKKMSIKNCLLKKKNHSLRNEVRLVLNYQNYLNA